jgi:hypothetical protein
MKNLLTPNISHIYIYIYILYYGKAIKSNESEDILYRSNEIYVPNPY